MQGICDVCGMEHYVKFNAFSRAKPKGSSEPTVSCGMQGCHGRLKFRWGKHNGTWTMDKAYLNGS